MRSSVRPSTGRLLTGVALLGAASGMRSTAGLAAVVVRAGQRRLPGPLGQPLAKPAAAAAVAAEIVVDKLPSTGSRLEPAGMVGRVAFAALAGGLAAHQAARSVVPSVLVAVTTAALTAKIAHDVREQLSRTAPDRGIGAAEDMLAMATGWLGGGMAAVH